jgi:hypothetical protein
MNTKSKQSQKNQSRQKQGPKKENQGPNGLHDDRKPHEQEHPETRMTR